MCPAKKQFVPLFKQWSRVIDDWPRDIIPVNETRVCARDRCGAWTWWAIKGQRTKGYCLTCIPGASFWRTTPEHDVRIMRLLMETFPGSTWSGGVVRRYAPDTYDGPDAGPCRRCHGRIRLYGLEGYPLCTNCEENS